MQNTVNLNLKKPDQNDFVNIGDINDNMDILDAEVAKKYVKPLAGIPSLDLDSATQAALKKAETALQTVTKSSVGLGNVDNTSDVNKPVSTAQQVALDKKANLASPSLTGTPTAPTAAESTNTQQIATTAFVDRAVKTHQAEYAQFKTSIEKEVAELQNANELSVVKSVKDSEGIFKTVTYKRKWDNTIFAKSVLSGGTSPQYTTRTLTFYNADGITVKATKIYTLSYDADGDLVSEV